VRKAAGDTTERRIRALFATHPEVPLEVVIPILEQAGRGEQEFEAQVYNTQTELSKGIMRILGLEDKSMRTVAKLVELKAGFYGKGFQPIELTDSKLSFSIPDCPMLHVGKDVSLNMKRKFCDAHCAGGSRAVMDAVLGPHRGTCTWDKALIRGAKKCTVMFESVKPVELS